MGEASTYSANEVEERWLILKNLLKPIGDLDPVQRDTLAYVLAEQRAGKAAPSPQFSRDAARMMDEVLIRMRDADANARPAEVAGLDSRLAAHLQQWRT